MEGLGSVGCLLARLLQRLTRFKTCALHLTLPLQTFHSGLMDFKAMMILAQLSANTLLIRRFSVCMSW